VKRGDLVRHLRRHGCHLKREGRSHSLWINPATGAVEAVPRHTEISDKLVRKIWPVRPGDWPMSLSSYALEQTAGSDSLAAAAHPGR
jgi:predicted RNA binding protein YcfA (HicA-like mRNA interferase family)